MVKRAVLVVAGLLVVLLAGAAGGVYAFDTSRRDVIADGVVVGGVEIGGLHAHDARARLRRVLGSRFFRPVTLTHPETRFVLSPAAAQIEVDVAGMVGEALVRSRSGNMLTRAWRDATDEGVGVQIPVRMTFSRAAVDAVVKRAARRLYRRPHSASVDFTLTEILRNPSRDGRAVRPDPLRRRITAALVDPSLSRTIAIPTRPVKPETTTEELESKYSHVITVSREEKRLRLFERLRLVKTYTVAIGQVAYSTPTGLYRIESKAVNPSWYVPRSDWAGELAGRIIPPGPQNPIKARWMGFYNGAGIHGTDALSSLGRAASHGCVRMSIPEVIELYDRVPLKTPLYIA